MHISNTWEQIKCNYYKKELQLDTHQWFGVTVEINHSVHNITIMRFIIETTTPELDKEALREPAHEDRLKKGHRLC